MTSDFIKTVNEADFEYEVVAYSNQVPVIVDFWADWCRPCKTLTPLLEKLAQEAQGAYRLAKVNVDDNPNLALRFNVRSIPNVKAFRDGHVVSEFLGLQPEPRIRDFIRNLAPSQIDLLLEKGQSQLESMSWNEAGNSFRQFLEKSPDNPAGLLGLFKACLMQGAYSEAKRLMDHFSASPEFARLELLKPLYHALADDTIHVQDSDDPLNAAYNNAIQLIKRGFLPAAMDGLIDILRQDKHYHDDASRVILLGLFEVLSDNHSLTQQYRRELAMVLF
ncbi:MAG: co-chaperone YbbN [Anaerolineales bacterium]|nr:MAG: co-chaperone YbbN [Anaerolineales bacterium]